MLRDELMHLLPFILTTFVPLSQIHLESWLAYLEQKASNLCLYSTWQDGVLPGS